MDLGERTALRDALADPSVPKSELDLHRVRRRLEREHAAGALAPGDYHDLAGVVAAHLGERGRAIDHCREAMRAGATVARQYDLGVALYQAGHLAEASAAFEDLARRHTSMALRVARANCATARNDREAARALLAEALERLDPSRPSDLLRLVPALAAARMDQEALIVFAAHLCRVHQVADPEVETDAMAVIAKAPTEVLERLRPFWPMDLDPLLAARTRNAP